MAARAMNIAARSVSICPASERRARLPERTPPTASRTRMEPVTPMAQSMRVCRTESARGWEGPWGSGIMELFYPFHPVKTQEQEVFFLHFKGGQLLQELAVIAQLLLIYFFSFLGILIRFVIHDHPLVPFQEGQVQDG